MKKPLLLSALLFLFAGCLVAQQPTGAITIFSEDGNKFFLVLNGQKQNAASQTNVRVDGLTQPYYNAKVIFEDKTIDEIGKNLMVTSGGQPDLMDVTYKLKKDKNGKMVLRYFSATAMQPNYVAPPDVYVMHFGVPAGETISGTTTTTTTTGGPAAVNMNVNGVNMNMSVNDPNMTTTTQTTVTHSTTTTTSGDPNLMMGNNSAPVASGSSVSSCAGQWPMNSGNFGSALSTIKNQGFDETKLSTAKQIAGSNCLDANQVSAICKEFGFEENKLKFAKFAYDHCTEPNNYFKINNVFGFSTSVDDLNKYIQTKQ